MTILNFEEELKNYNARVTFYNEIIGELGVATEVSPLLQSMPAAATNDTDTLDAGMTGIPSINTAGSEITPALQANAPGTISNTDPDQLYNQYQHLTTLTTTLDKASLTPPCSPCGLYNKQKFQYRRDKLLEAAERLKTAILQTLLQQIVADLGITEALDILKKENALSLWKKIATYFVWSTVLLYGGIKGYSAMAGVLSAFITGGKSLALIIPSAISAAIFCLMLMAFEGHEICNANGLNGNQRATRAQFGQQYQLAASMGDVILTQSSQDSITDDRQATLKKYHGILNKIHSIDLAPKITIANNYRTSASKSTLRKAVEVGAGGILSVLNGASFGFIGVSTVALIAKCSLAVLLTAATLSTPAGIAALATFALLFIAGCAVAWYVKKLGPNLVRAFDKKDTLIRIAKEEQKNPLDRTLQCSSTFFQNQENTQRIREQEREIEQLRTNTLQAVA